jgi:hypothetical protein
MESEQAALVAGRYHIVRRVASAQTGAWWHSSHQGQGLVRGMSLPVNSGRVLSHQSISCRGHDDEKVILS